MRDGEHLLSAILAEPDDDLHRLVYADWLDEQGDAARAEFIRANINMARNPGRDSLARMQATGEAWRTMLPEGLPAVTWHGGEQDFRLAAPGVIGVQFRRGFVERVCCSLRGWLCRGAAIVRLHPVERVEVTDRYPDLEDGAAVWRQADATLPQEHHLPAVVFGHLADYTSARLRIVDRMVACYPDIPTALDALSAALLRVVRHPAETHYASTIDALSAFRRRFLRGTSGD